MAQGYMEIGEPWLSIIVTVAGVLILSGWVQQLVKGYRTKSLKDISRYLLLLIFVLYSEFPSCNSFFGDDTST